MIYVFFAILALALLASCNNGKGPGSPFSDILNRPPFAALTDSIGRYPRNDELYFRRAVLLDQNNFPEPALADFQKAWSLKKDEKYAFGITNAWIEQKPDSAIRFLHEALKAFPRSYLLKVSLARAYERTGKTNEALYVCNDLLREIPELTEVWILQSQLYDSKGDSSNALISLENARRLQPDNFAVASDIAYRYAENKNQRALTLCDTLIRMDSLGLFEQPFYIKGIYYSNINDKAKALHYFDETIKRNHNNLSAYIEKGRIILDQKKTAEAFSVFRLANAIKPAFPDAWYWMAVCQEKLGQKEDALLNYQKAFSLDKSFTEAKEAADRLSK